MDDPATELWLVRHGESTGNRDGILQGQEDLPLSELGRAQAARVGRRLAGAGCAALYTSDLERARDTAGAIADAMAGALTPVIEPALREIDSGTWSGLTDAQVRARFPDEWRRWHEERDPALRRGGGESYDLATARFGAALATIARRHPGARVAVVSHGGVIRAAVARLIGLDLRRIWALSIANASITRVRPFAPITARPDGPCGRALSVNDTAHLDGLAA